MNQYFIDITRDSYY